MKYLLCRGYGQNAIIKKYHNSPKECLAFADNDNYRIQHIACFRQIQLHRVNKKIYSFFNFSQRGVRYL